MLASMLSGNINKISTLYQSIENNEMTKKKEEMFSRRELGRMPPPWCFPVEQDIVILAQCICWHASEPLT